MAVPNAPTLIAPANGARITTGTPTLVFDHNDPSGAPVASYGIQVSTSQTFSTVTHLNQGNQTSGISGNRITRVYNGSTLTRGTTYYWRARTSNADGVSNWSAVRSFRFNRLPTATKVSPVANGFAVIWNNATDTTTWTSGGSHAKPRFRWTFSDLDGDAQTLYQVRIYSAATGGSLLHDSGYIASAAKQYDAPWAGVQGVQYWWTINVRDAYNEWSGESSRTAFKMRWGQAIYQYQLPALGSSKWAFTTPALTNPGQLAFMFRTASGAGGSGAGSWRTAIGAVDRKTTGTEWLNVLVRLVSTSPGLNPSLTSMAFKYTGQAVQPDQWEFVTPADWVLDASVRRFGSQALRCTANGTSNRYAWQDVSVSRHTEYTLSGYVSTGATPTTGFIALRAYSGGDFATHIAASDLITDTTGDREGWRRATVTFNSGDEDTIRVVAHINNPAVGDMFWVDSLQLEESPIATPWQPGLAGDAAVVDVGGVIVDAVNGGIFRLRTSEGRQISLTTTGLDMDDGWLTPSYSGGWTQYSNYTVGYRKDASGYVHLRGMVASGTVGSAAFTLPEGYRPVGGNIAVFPTISNGAFGRVNIGASNGQVIPASPSNNTWVSLDGITFKAEG